MPNATASPCRIVKFDNCSSLCALQWPKSSGRDEPISNGSPLPICSTCNSAQRLIRYLIASMSLAASAGAFLQSHLKNALSLIRDTFTASDIPEHHSPSDNV